LPRRAAPCSSNRTASLSAITSCGECVRAHESDVLTSAAAVVRVRACACVRLHACALVHACWSDRVHACAPGQAVATDPFAME
jgi:hypothetical protein